MTEPRPPLLGDPAHPYPNVPSPQRPRSSRLVKWLIIGLVVFGLAILALFATCLYIGVSGPDTKVLPGRQVPAKFIAQIRTLDVLEPGEQIEYFYSDAVVNIEDGFYLLTDRKVVVYSRAFDEPAILVPFSDIEQVEADFSDNWFVDSLITLTLTDGTYVSFPASSESGGDRKMYDTLKKKMEAEQTP